MTGKILEELPTLCIQYLTQLFNAILLRGYFSSQWKVAQIILIPKPSSQYKRDKNCWSRRLLSVRSLVYQKKVGNEFILEVHVKPIFHFFCLQPLPCISPPPAIWVVQRVHIMNLPFWCFNPLLSSQRTPLLIEFHRLGAELLCTGSQWLCIWISLRAQPW
jgi:hypothetical protein